MEGTRSKHRMAIAAAAAAAASAAAAAATAAEAAAAAQEEEEEEEDFYDEDEEGGNEESSVEYDYGNYNAGEYGEQLDFQAMDEAQMRQWVEANPGRVNDRDKHGETPLYVAARRYMGSLPLTVWMLDEKCANVHTTESTGYTALHWAKTLDILNALLDRDC